MNIKGNNLLIKGIINVLGTIPIPSIKNVTIEDSSLERFTATRMVLMGVLGLAFKKKKKAFVLVVEWADEGIINETTFLYEGFLCNQAINTDYGMITETRKKEIRDKIGQLSINSATPPFQPQTASIVEDNDKYGFTPLHEAAIKGQKGEAELLVAKGMDVNAKDKDGRTPLYAAAGFDHEDVAELLIAKGSDVNSKDQDGFTPLHVTSVMGCGDVAELLITKDADWNAKADEGLTPLFLAYVSEREQHFFMPNYEK